MKKYSISIVFVFCIQFVSAQNAIPSIEIATVKKHLYALASDAMEGRQAGSSGIENAAQYIETAFEDIGLTKYNDLPTYRQKFKANGLDLFNVIGVLEGKRKKDEFVVISAHYDHLGVKKEGTGDLIYNGADDDASGTSAVLTLAQYFKELGTNERTLIFVAFTAEEMGLLGSRYFGQDVNASQFIAGINIEMIGKDSSYGPNTAWLTGFYRSDFGTIIQKNLSGTSYTVHPDPYPTQRLFFRSDNASLAQLGIPSHTFSTVPIDTDVHYHQVSDEAATLDMEIITQTIRAIALGTRSIVSGEDTPTRVILAEGEGRRK